jgi:DNA-binding IscR family transcriptional regulator
MSIIPTRGQYALLFILYLHRSGRASVTQVSKGLRLPRAQLQRVAADLLSAGLLASYSGKDGGYEVVGEPTVGQAVLAVNGAVNVISPANYEALMTGDAEHRSLAALFRNIQKTMMMFYQRKIKALGLELAANEISMLDKAVVSRAVN